jgi:hypothetical protein
MDLQCSCVTSALQDVCLGGHRRNRDEYSRLPGEAKSSTNPQPKTMYVGTSVGLEDR